MLEMQQACDEAVVQAAKQICMAAVTAPTACGRDTVTCGVLTGDEVRRLAEEMVRMEREVPNCKPIFVRDAELVSQCPAVVLLGCRGQSRGLTPCGLCGHVNCGACHAAGGHCAFDDMDLGIAIGSACAMAAFTDVALALAFVQALDEPEHYAQLIQTLQTQVERVKKRRAEEKAHQKNVRQGKKKPSKV